MTAEEMVKRLREYAKHCDGVHACWNDTTLKAAASLIESQQAVIERLRVAISRYCHNDCYRDSCEGNEDVGIPDCPLARFAPDAPKGEA